MIGVVLCLKYFFIFINIQNYKQMRNMLSRDVSMHPSSKAVAGESVPEFGSDSDTFEADDDEEEQKTLAKEIKQGKKCYWW